MKKIMMLFAAVFAAFIMCGCADSDIEGVKNGVLSLDNTRTVEDAVDAVMKNVKWRKFVSDSNSTIVEVTGVWTDDIYEKTYEHMLKKAKAIDPNFDESGFTAVLSGLPVFKLFPFPGDKVLLQFAIAADGESFQFSYGEITGKDGKVKNYENQLMVTSACIDRLQGNGTFLSWIYVVSRNELKTE